MRIAVSCLMLLLAGCAPRGDMVLAPEAAAIAQDTRTIFVGTNRALTADGRFGPDRGTQTQFLRYDIAIPPGHVPGQLRKARAGRAPDLARDFLATNIEEFADARAFHDSLGAALMAQPPHHREAVVFVHGYNTRHAEGIYRLAQLAHDIRMPGVKLHFAWPSAGNPTVYAYDRDSALFSRDKLEAFLEDVAAAGPDRIILVAHSMGSLLTMETLRQMAIAGRQDLLARIRGVVLISPDLDIDVFRTQAERVTPLPQPFLIVSSQRDRVLEISALLTGHRTRLGQIGDVSALADLDVTVVDVSAFSGGLGHFTLGTSPALIRIAEEIDDIDAAFGQGPTARPGVLPGTFLTLRRATQVVLAPLDDQDQTAP